MSKSATIADALGGDDALNEELLTSLRDTVGSLNEFAENVSVSSEPFTKTERKTPEPKRYAFGVRSCDPSTRTSVGVTPYAQGMYGFASEFDIISELDRGIRGGSYNSVGHNLEPSCPPCYGFPTTPFFALHASRRVTPDTSGASRFKLGDTGWQKRTARKSIGHLLNGKRNRPCVSR